MPRQHVFVYLVIAALLGAFGFAVWLASEGRFLEGVSVIGVAATLAWFAVRVLHGREGDGK